MDTISLLHLRNSNKHITVHNFYLEFKLYSAKSKPLSGSFGLVAFLARVSTTNNYAGCFKTDGPGTWTFNPQNISIQELHKTTDKISSNA